MIGITPNVLQSRQQVRAQAGEIGSARAPGADFQVGDVCAGVDTSSVDKPLVDGCGDVSGTLVDSAGEVRSIKPTGGSRSVGALFGVVGALDDVAANTGRVGAASGGVDVAAPGETHSEGQAQALTGGFGDQGAQAGGSGGDGLCSCAAGAGTSGSDQECFGADAGFGASGGGAAGDVPGGDSREFGGVGDSCALDRGEDLGEGGDEGCAFVLCVELGDEGGVAVDDAGDVAFGVAGCLELVGELGCVVELWCGGRRRRGGIRTPRCWRRWAGWCGPCRAGSGVRPRWWGR